MNVSTTTGLKYNGQTTMPSFEFGVCYMFMYRAVSPWLLEFQGQPTIGQLA
jgi:hypothetical protein